MHRGFWLGIVCGLLVGAALMRLIEERPWETRHEDAALDAGVSDDARALTANAETYEWRGETIEAPRQPLDCEERRAVVIALGRMGDPRALGPLMALREEASAPQNRCFVKELAASIKALSSPPVEGVAPWQARRARNGASAE